MHNGKRITLKDIAAMAGVDKALVSKVVNHVAEGEISPAKRAKIEEIVQRCGYVPSSSARALANGRTRQLMFLFSDSTYFGLSNDYYANMLQGVHDVCAANGYNCVLNIHDFSSLREFILPENLRNFSIDGCLLAGFFDRKLISELSAISLPFVTIEQFHDDGRIPVVNSANRIDTTPLFDYCRKTGHHRIWLTTGYFLRKRIERETGLVISEIRDDTSKIQECAMDLVQKFASLPESERPDMIVCKGHVCLYLLQELEKRGIVCPRDVSLMSTSDFEAHRWCRPAVSLAVQNSRELGIFSAELLLELVTGRISNAEACKKAGEKEFPVHIVERDSVKVIPLPEQK